MRWFKRGMWKTAIALAGILLILVLMVWIPVSAVGADESASGLATPLTGTVQATPTMDPTMAALQKEQLTLQNDKLKNDNAWAWLSPISTILGPLATIGTILVGILVARNNLLQWYKNREDEQKKRAEDQRVEREKRDEERFQKVVEGLGSERIEAKVGAAITLRTFLEPGYERFYRQAFDLAVAHLRLRKAEASAPGPLSLPAQVPIVPKGSLLQKVVTIFVRLQKQQTPPTTSIPLNSLSQALITVFRESFPLAREELKKNNAQFDPRLLDATDVQLDNAYLARADLAEARLVRASLCEADLTEAQLKGTNLQEARLEGANLTGAHLEGADLFIAELKAANLTKAHLEGANLLWSHLEGADLFIAELKAAKLTRAHLEGANLNMTCLKGADLILAYLEGANFMEADLEGAILIGADLEGADLHHAHLEGAILSRADLTGTNPEDAFSLKGTAMYNVTGLTPEQQEKCIKKGATFDDGHEEYSAVFKTWLVKYRPTGGYQRGSFQQRFIDDARFKELPCHRRRDYLYRLEIFGYSEEDRARFVELWKAMLLQP